MPNIGRKIASWNQLDIVEQEVKYRLENWEELHDEEPKESEENIRDSIYQDSEFLEMEYENLIEYLTTILQKKNPKGYWRAYVNHFGWRDLCGDKYMYATEGKELISNTLPDTDCTFYMCNYGRGIAIQNFHHDSPVGKEWYYLTPIGERTYNNNV